MRTWWVALLLVSSTAVADPKPDLVVTWGEGEQSRDSSMSTVKLTVTGTKLHYASSYEGRFAGRSKPVDVDGVVKDPKKVAAAIAKLDGIKLRSKLGKGPTHYRLRSGCVQQRGRTERCAEVSGDAPDPADLKAIAALRDLLLEGIEIPASAILKP